MKLAILKVIKKEPTIQSPERATIADKLSHLIHVVAAKPMRPRRVRHLDVDAVLARSLPKVGEGVEKAA